MNEEKIDFESYNSKLQEIIKKLEKNDLSIEEGTKLYENGVKIAKKCLEILNNCKGKVIILKNELEDLMPNSNDEVEDE